jgi:hypothetical protein
MLALPSIHPTRIREAARTADLASALAGGLSCLAEHASGSTLPAGIVDFERYVDVAVSPCTSGSAV